MLISKALTAPEVVFGVGVGVGVPDVDALEDVLDTVVDAFTDEDTVAATDVVIVRLDALLEEETTALEEETTAVLLLVGLEEVCRKLVLLGQELILVGSQVLAGVFCQRMEDSYRALCKCSSSSEDDEEGRGTHFEE